MPAKRLAGAALRGLAFALLILMAALPAMATPAAPTPATVAFGLIVGYREAADELSAEHTERGPWADRRQREQAAWKRATQRSREKTQALAKSAGVAVRGVGEAGRAALMRLDKPLRGQALEDAIRRLRLHPDVAWVEPDILETKRLIPDDPEWGSQWHLFSNSVFPASINMTAAWSRLTGEGFSPVVAVVDTGIASTPNLSDFHPELAGRLLPGYDFVSELWIANDGNGRDGDPSDPGDWLTLAETNTFGSIYYRNQCGWIDERTPPSRDLDSSWHGTFIAGQIAATSDNGVNVAGIHWGARVLPVRVAGKCGALVSDLLDGARWAAGLPVNGAPPNGNPARIINLSFGGSRSCSVSESPAYRATVNELVANGVLLVVAAGNNGTALSRPADCPGVLAVGAVRRDGLKTHYSSYGANLALSAPGGSGDPDNIENDPYDPLWSLDNRSAQGPGAHDTGGKMGTSFSAPLAAGVASLMLTINPDLSPVDLVERMQAGAKPFPLVHGYGYCNPNLNANGLCNCTTNTCGAGILDADEALRLAYGPAVIIEPVGTVQPSATITLDGSRSKSVGSRDIATYGWTFVSGPGMVSIPDSDKAITSLRLPNTPGSWVFKLTVEDDAGDSGSGTITVVASSAVSGGGGALGGAWGVGLWAWVLALAWRQRRP